MNKFITTLLIALGIIAVSNVFNPKLMEAVDYGLFPIQITGGDFQYIADVFESNGVKRLQVSMIDDDSGDGIATTKFATSKRYYEFLLNSETTPKKTMFQDCDNGSYTANKCIFEAGPHPTETVVVQQIRCFARCDGVKFANHICDKDKLKDGLDDGLIISFKSKNEVFTFPTIHFTEDWKNLFSFPGVANEFRMDNQGDEDQFISIYRPDTPYILDPQGTHGVGNDDYIKIELSDDMTVEENSDVDDPTDETRAYMNCLAEGYRL